MIFPCEQQSFNRALCVCWQRLRVMRWELTAQHTNCVPVEDLKWVTPILWLYVQRSRCQHVVLPSFISDPESEITLWCTRWGTHCLRQTFVFFVAHLQKPTSAACVVCCPKFSMWNSISGGTHNLKARAQDRWLLEITYEWVAIFLTLRNEALHCKRMASNILSVSGGRFAAEMQRRRLRKWGISASQSMGTQKTLEK